MRKEGPLLKWPRNFCLKIFPIVCLLLLFPVSLCFAADAAATASGLPWDDFLTKMYKEFTGPIPQAFAVMATTMAGIMLLFGECGGTAKRALQIVLGVSLALQAGNWVEYVTDMTPDKSSVSDLKDVPDLTKANFLTAFMGYFIGICQNGAYSLQGPVLKIFLSLAAINLAVSFALKFDQDHIKTIFKETLRMGIFVFLIKEWVGGMWGIARHLGEGFSILGIKAAGSTAASADVDKFIQNAFDTVNVIWQGTCNYGVGSFTVVIGNLLATAGIVICTFLTAVEIVVTGIEFWVITTLSIPLFSFGVFSQFKYLFEKATGAVFSLGMKLMVITFIGAVSCPLLSTMAQGVKNAMASPNGSGFSALLRLFLGCLVIYMLTKKVPDLAQGLISGSPSMSGSDGMSTMRSMASSATGAAAGAMSVGGAMALASALPGGRDANGSMRFGGMATNLVKMGYAKMAQPFHNTVNSNLRNMSERIQNNEDLARSTDREKGVYGPHRKPDRDMGESLRRRISHKENPDGSANLQG
jgi:type IV secretion system protein TrbL